MTDETTPTAAADSESDAETRAQHAAETHSPEAISPTPAPEGAAAAAPADDEPAGPGFEAMNLKPELLQALADMGYERPMEVQTAVFDRLSQGRDLMVQARTGTGKTAAFGIPIINRLADNPAQGAQVLILAPIRELALQVANELQQIARLITDLRVVPIYGGAPMKKQIDALAEGAQIIAGTPGRVLDHIRRRTLKTADIRLLVLDECDEMLSMGFQEEIDAIIETLPPREDRQTLLFSATIPAEIQRIARRHMREPESISLSTGGISVDEIEHYYYVVSGMGRTRDLIKVLKAEHPESAIIFCNTREDTNTVAKFLSRQGYNAKAISSDLSQSDRERVMREMREGKIAFLVATDVAARGIDISDLSHVINYTFPESPEVYVHRTGRTGRAGKEGVAISLVGPREIGAFYYLKLIYKIRPEERELPSAEQLAAMQEGERYEQVVKLVPERPADEYLSLAKRLWQSAEGERVVAALLERLFKGPRPARARQPARAEAEDRQPRPSRRRDAAAGEATRAEQSEEREPQRSRRDTPEAGDARDRGPRRARRGERGERDDRDGTRRRRRRRRRDEGEAAGADAGPEIKPLETRGEDGAPKEFWEAWADEKERESAETPAVEPEAGGGAAAPEGGDGPAVTTTRLYVNLGKREEVTADEIRELLGEWLGGDAAQIGSVALRSTHAYVRVPDELVDRVIEAATGKHYKDREIVVERARR